MSIARLQRGSLKYAIALGILSLGVSAGAQALEAKQLAGAPEEFAEMRAPDPASSAIHSKSALLPIEMGMQKNGRLGWEGKLPVENGNLRFLIFAEGSDAWQVDLVNPSGRLEKSAAQLAAKRTRFGMEEAQMEADLYALDGVQNGNWTLKISTDNQAVQRGYLLVEGDEHTELASHLSHARQLVGEKIGLVARLTATDLGDQVLLGKSAGNLQRADLRVTFPDGRIETFPMFDDGLNDDGLAGDGVFGGSFLAKSAGDHLAQVIVQGANRHGQAIVRSAEHPIPVIRPTLQLSAAKAMGAAVKGDGTRLQINLPVSAEKSDAHYRAYGEVWGQDKSGKSIPVAWIGGMVSPKNGALGLGFDERWVARAGAQAPFELRNLRIEDPDHFVTIASAKRLELGLPAQRLKAGADLSIDDTMLMGPRPSGISAKATGKRLLLVHGYCSGGVWPAGQFSTASTFLDANQNRTHDQFAQRIRNYGANWNSFGVVAHSQGGAASLHLYTYYWSGLDNATGNRLIQSVGTPYQGTNLAGILATLGNWFGVGCGTNSNLSYSGAKSWLAGIPTWARGKVNYYTTSFKTTNWWTNDYCNFATDLVLSDPEDGTTERAYGQLPSGINRGHTTGQCHTAGMRDPAQYHDTSRNATMNSNAAR